MRTELLVVSILFGLLAIAMLVKAARHTWHIEVLKQQRKD